MPWTIYQHKIETPTRDFDQKYWTWRHYCCETKRDCATWQDKQLTLQEHFSLQRLCPLQYSQRSWSLFQSRPLPCMNSPLWSTANTCLLHRSTWSARGHAAQQIMINQVVWRHKRMAIGMTEERDISLFLVLHQCMARHSLCWGIKLLCGGRSVFPSVKKWEKKKTSEKNL